jgi:hypothetical protein
MVVHIHSKDTFINLNIPKYIPKNTQNTPLCIHRAITKLVTFVINWTHVVISWMKTKLNVHMEG